MRSSVSWLRACCGARTQRRSGSGSGHPLGRIHRSGLRLRARACPLGISGVSLDQNHHSGSVCSRADGGVSTDQNDNSDLGGLTGAGKELLLPLFVPAQAGRHVAEGGEDLGGSALRADGAERRVDPLRGSSRNRTCSRISSSSSGWKSGRSPCSAGKWTCSSSAKCASSEALEAVQHLLHLCEIAAFERAQRGDFERVEVAVLARDAARLVGEAEAKSRLVTLRHDVRNSIAAHRCAQKRPVKRSGRTSQRDSAVVSGGDCAAPDEAQPSAVKRATPLRLAARSECPRAARRCPDPVRRHLATTGLSRRMPPGRSRTKSASGLPDRYARSVPGPSPTSTAHRRDARIDEAARGAIERADPPPSFSPFPPPPLSPPPPPARALAPRTPGRPQTWITSAPPGAGASSTAVFQVLDEQRIDVDAPNIPTRDSERPCASATPISQSNRPTPGPPRGSCPSPPSPRLRLCQDCARANNLQKIT